MFILDEFSTAPIGLIRGNAQKKYHGYKLFYSCWALIKSVKLKKEKEELYYLHLVHNSDIYIYSELPLSQMSVDAAWPYL